MLKHKSFVNRSCRRRSTRFHVTRPVHAATCALTAQNKSLKHCHILGILVTHINTYFCTRIFTMMYICILCISTSTVYVCMYMHTLPQFRHTLAAAAVMALIPHRHRATSAEGFEIIHALYTLVFGWKCVYAQVCFQVSVSLSFSLPPMQHDITKQQRNTHANAHTPRRCTFA